MRRAGEDTIEEDERAEGGALRGPGALSGPAGKLGGLLFWGTELAGVFSSEQTRQGIPPPIYVRLFPSGAEPDLQGFT